MRPSSRQLLPFLLLSLLVVCIAPQLGMLGAAHAELRTLLITANTRYTLPSTSLLQRRRRAPANQPPAAATPRTPKCLAAIGFAHNYPIINDKCVLSRWRPGQAWRFDDQAPDRWQPIRVGHPGSEYCLSVNLDGRLGSDAQPVPSSPPGATVAPAINFAVTDVGAPLVVRPCPLTGAATAAPDEAMWRVTGNGNNTVWFRNLRSKLCLTASDADDAFVVRDCRDDPLQQFSLQWL